MQAFEALLNPLLIRCLVLYRQLALHNGQLPNTADACQIHDCLLIYFYTTVAFFICDHIFYGLILTDMGRISATLRPHHVGSMPPADACQTYDYLLLMDFYTTY